MKTLQAAVEEERKKREDKRREDQSNLRVMIEALNLPPDDEDANSPTVNPLGGCNLRHKIADTTIHLMYHAAGKDRMLFIECYPTGFIVKYEDFGSANLTLEEALKTVAAWYLNLVEKYS